jgi:HEAT repeat protein
MRSALFLVVPLLLAAQTPKDVRQAAKPGVSAIPTVAGYLRSSDVNTRVEAVKQLIAIGGKDTLDPLIQATSDSDGEVQMRATDGLVNYYLPGYVKQGIGSTVVRAGSAIRAKFGETTEQTIDTWVIVRPDVVTALGHLARGGSSFDSRANACRALGILRGRAAVPDLVDALRSKDNGVMVEALVALRKIGDPEAGPKVTYLLHDLDDRVQGAAIETAGILRSRDALPTLRGIVKAPRNNKAQRAALNAIAMMPEKDDRGLLAGMLKAKDDRERASGAEGLGRLEDPADVPELERLWKDEEKMAPRLAAAFGLVMDGRVAAGEDTPLWYLVSTLNSGPWRDTALAYLVEAARKGSVRNALYPSIERGMRAEKTGLALVLASSGDSGSVAYLEKLSRDTDAVAAQDGLKALRSLQARLGQ